MTVLETIKKSTEYLEKKGVESARLQSELMLASLLGMPRLHLYLNFERALTPDQINVLRGQVQRRGAREPLQHILGSTSFCGFEIVVSPHVLVPRPETEILAELGWRFLAARAIHPAQPPTACDFGTGSGCIAISLAKEVPAARVWAIDRSSAALEIARQNIDRHGLSDRIRLLEASRLPPSPDMGPVDLIISNPPYIPSATIPLLEPEVRDFDPHLALDGGADGLEFYRQLAAQAPECLREDGRLMVELGDEQDEAAADTFAQQGWSLEEKTRDLSGKIRVLTLRWK